MAKVNLSTSYQNDVFDGKRKYKMINNSDGTVSFEDVTKYTQVGSSFDAQQLNTIAKAVNDSFDKSKVISDINTLKNTMSSGYVVDASVLRKLLLTGYFLKILKAGTDTITVEDASITEDSTIKVQVNKFGAACTSMKVTAGKVVLTFPTMSEDMQVKVWVQ